ncbi:MAG: peptidyl-prolyl cis-trans isomerase A (cyclophilin A) [Patiriisocius sp.]|jgi:peptidyl-prolyl cis-trans isomerase A (cyclophilin A)
MEEGIFATIHTPKGKVKLNLEFEKTPITVANFIGLAEGKIKNELKGQDEPYYDGLNFHRVISVHNGDGQDFMVQGGCPEKSGRGNPGYSFQDEFDPSLVHDRPGILSMANAGPHTNGSQFFITCIPTPHLNGGHTVFGHVIEGLEVVTGGIVSGDEISKVEIEYVGENAKSFDAATIFNAGATLQYR